jgi:hypothetical protein
MLGQHGIVQQMLLPTMNAARLHTSKLPRQEKERRAGFGGLREGLRGRIDGFRARQRGKRYAVSSTGTGATAFFFIPVVVIKITLANTSRVPRTVRRPSASPPRKYPTSTATTGFT